MSRNVRVLVVLVVALLCATVTSYAVFRAMSRLTPVSAGPATVPTLVAAHPIPAGTLLTADMVKVVAWPAGSLVPGSIGDPRQVVDRGAVVAIAENEPLTSTKLAAAGAGAGLPPTIPPGMRAISVRVNEVIGVAGFVVPGTRVDVVVTFERNGESDDSLARVVVSNVQVLTAGTRYDQEKARQDARPIPTSVITLLVTPEDAERIALAASGGRITLTLRNPLDTAPTEGTGISMARLMGGAPPPPPAVRPPSAPRRQVREAAPQPLVPPREPYTVEAIRGAKRTQEQVRGAGEEIVK